MPQCHPRFAVERFKCYRHVQFHWEISTHPVVGRGDNIPLLIRKTIGAANSFDGYDFTVETQFQFRKDQ